MISLHDISSALHVAYVMGIIARHRFVFIYYYGHEFKIFVVSMVHQERIIHQLHLPVDIVAVVFVDYDDYFLMIHKYYNFLSFLKSGTFRFVKCSSIFFPSKSLPLKYFFCHSVCFLGLSKNSLLD